MFCHNNLGIPKVEKQAGERRVGCGAPTRRFTTPGNAGRFKGLRDFEGAKILGVVDGDVGSAKGS